MIAVGVTLMVAWSLAAEPGSETLNTIIRGQAPVVHGDRAGARGAAVSAALREALVSGAGVIDSVTMLEGATQIQDKILRHASAYVPSYDASPDTPESIDSGVYTVELSNVVVRRDQLAHDVAAIQSMLSSRAHPTICTIIREDISSEPNDSAASNAADWTQGQVHQRLMGLLKPLGWTFVDARELPASAAPGSHASGSPQHLQGRDFDPGAAQYVIVGSVSIHPAAVDRAMRGAVNPAEARLAIRVTNPETSDTVAAVETNHIVISRSSTEEAIDKATRQAALLIGNALVSTVFQKWRDASLGSGILRLEVDVDDYSALAVFEKAVGSRTAGVKSVEEVSYEDGKAELKVIAAGVDAKHFAARLEHAKLPGHLRVVRVGTSLVEVEVTP